MAIGSTRNRALLLAASIAVLALHTENALGQTFSLTYEIRDPQTTRTNAVSVRAVPGGGYLLVGKAYTPTLSSWAAGIDEDGEISWQTAITGGWTSMYVGRPTSDGGFAVAGSIDGGMVAIKFDAGGAIEWQTALANDGSLVFNRHFDMQPAADGGYFLTADIWDSAADSHHGWLAKLSPDGEVAWQRFYLQHDIFGPIRSIEPTSDGGLIAAGVFACDTNAACSLLVKLDASGGVDWAQSYTFFPTRNDLALGAIQTHDGGYAMTGVTPDFSRGFVIKTDASGTIEWSRQFESVGGSAYHLVEQSDEGLVLALGVGNYRSKPMDVIKLDRYGNLVWSLQFGICGPHEVHDLALTADGGVIIAGTAAFASADDSTTDAWVLRLSPDGEIDGDCPYVADSPPSIWVSHPITADVVLTPTPALQPTMLSQYEATSIQLRPFEACGSGISLGYPDEISPPGSLVPLTWLDNVTLTWEDDPNNGAERFHLYRSSGRPDFVHLCFEPNLVPNQVTVDEHPPAEGLFTYLVSGVNDEGEGPLGRAVIPGSPGDCVVERRAGDYCP